MVAKKRKQRKPFYHRFDGETHYVCEISDWQWDYSFGLEDPKMFGNIFGDYRHLIITGAVVRPLNTSPTQMRVTLLPSEECNEGNWKKWKEQPSRIGTLNKHPDELDGVASVPADVIGPLLTMLVAGRLRFLLLDTSRLRYREAGIVRVKLRADMPEDESED